MKRITCVFLICITVMLCMPFTALAKNYTADEIYSIALDIISWKKTDNGSLDNGYLINNAYLEVAGTTPGDWYQIGMSRLGIRDDYAAYLAVIEQKIEERYATKNKLSASKATEWHRISLSVLASGGDPLSIGTDTVGNSINLIADGTYDRGKTASLGRQGINGWIWGLIALDSMRYDIPTDSYYSREDIILEIIKRQLSDGGFALSGKTSDPDITAMAIQALAPYYSRSDVKEVIDESLLFLSEAQLSTGDYASWGMPNVESTAQVVIALCCLGIDPLTDSRFIKDGNTLLDGILRYRMVDGGFVHSFTYDPGNPSSKPNESNTMAGEQTLLALAAVWRLRNGKSSIYDFRDSVNTETGGFSEEDKKIVDNLPEKLSTEYYVTVIKLLEKLENSGDFPEKEEYRQKLLSAKKEIEDIQSKIDEINSAIRDEISPNESDTQGSDSKDDSKNENIEKPSSSNENTTESNTDTDKKPSSDTDNIYNSSSSTENKKDNVSKNSSGNKKENVAEASSSVTEDNENNDSSIMNGSIDSSSGDKNENLTEASSSLTGDNANNASSIITENEDISSLSSSQGNQSENAEKSFSGKDGDLENTINSIIADYEELSEYDKQKIEGYEDVQKAKTKIVTQRRTVIIAVTAGIAFCVLAAFVILSIYKRKNAKKREMEELAALFEEEE